MSKLLILGISSLPPPSALARSQLESDLIPPFVVPLSDLKYACSLQFWLYSVPQVTASELFRFECGGTY